MRLVLFLSFLMALPSFAVRPDLKKLPIGLAPHEVSRAAFDDAILGDAPTGPIRALGEWEDSDEIMVLWNNPSLIKALSVHAKKVRLLADSESDKQWWIRWLDRNNIDKSKIDFYIVPTDSIWVRDYGPWYILDGNDNLGIVDTRYNRPRNQDDKVPTFVGKQTGVPVYHPGLVHTGGNFYSDGMGNGFSSTLVETENPKLNMSMINNRVASFLGIDMYFTAPLAPGITIEHIDTFGKPVSVDTWVVGQFPTDAKYYQDSENFVKKLKQLKSPYGTPYKIFRIPLPEHNGSWWGKDYRAYINSVIHNKTIYVAEYGNDQHDKLAKETYEKAMPGYRVQMVDAGGTTWGDSVHCRTRNIHSRNTIFMFPTVSRVGNKTTIRVEAIPSPGAKITDLRISVNSADGSRYTKPLSLRGDTYGTVLTEEGDFSFYLIAKDSNGLERTAPRAAPGMAIEVPE